MVLNGTREALSREPSSRTPEGRGQLAKGGAELSADICHDLKMSDIFRAPTTRLATRHASSRFQMRVHVLNMSELEAEVLPTDKVDRQQQHLALASNSGESHV